MCGIAGTVAVEDPDLVLRAMAAALRHRGPDGERYYVDPDATVGLAHRRLAIIDLSPAAA